MTNHEYVLDTGGELYHYGVVGMKWGIRRYQRKDGSITSEGVKRYRQVSAREDTAARGKYGKKVLGKYEKLKTAEQKQADKLSLEANRRLNQSRKDRKLGDDFDFLDEIDRPGSKLGKMYDAAIEADWVRAQAYAGAKWYNKYNRELVKAIDRDNRERNIYGR